MCVSFWSMGNRSRGPLTAVDHTEHGFAGKLKAVLTSMTVWLLSRRWQKLAKIGVPGAAEFPQQGSMRRRPVAARRVGAQCQRSWSWAKTPQRDVGRYLAERGLYCLPTGRRFELTENSIPRQHLPAGSSNLEQRTLRGFWGPEHSEHEPCIVGKVGSHEEPRILVIATKFARRSCHLFFVLSGSPSNLIESRSGRRLSLRLSLPAPFGPRITSIHGYFVNCCCYSRYR